MADRAQQVLDEDYEELLERLRAADFLYTEYSLEEVIYQLAKVMFAQSLARGEHSMQNTLAVAGMGMGDYDAYHHKEGRKMMDQNFLSPDLLFLPNSFLLSGSSL